MEPGEAKFLMRQIESIPNAIAILLYHHGKRLNYMVEVTEGAEADASNLIRTLNDRFHGHGGGKKRNAQGSAPYEEATAKDVQVFLQEKRA